MDLAHWELDYYPLGQPWICVIALGNGVFIPARLEREQLAALVDFYAVCLGSFFICTFANRYLPQVDIACVS